MIADVLWGIEVRLPTAEDEQPGAQASLLIAPEHICEGEQHVPPQNMPLWQDYFELSILRCSENRVEVTHL